MGLGGHQASRPAEDTSAGDTEGRHDPGHAATPALRIPLTHQRRQREGPVRRPARGPLPATAHEATVRRRPARRTTPVPGGSRGPLLSSGPFFCDILTAR